MYGFSDTAWKYIWQNVDFWEVFVPSKNGKPKAKARQELWESKGYEVVPYEDIGVSTGIYVMKKGGKRTYRESKQ